MPCHGAEYMAIQGVAWLGVFIYPIGLPVAYITLLLTARANLIASKKTPLTHALRFLHSEYKPEFFWWELVEVLRRFLLVGVAVLISPGSLVQLIFGSLTSSLFLVLQVQAAPFKSKVDASLALMTSTSLVILFLGGFILKIGTLVELEDVREQLPPALLASFTVRSDTLSFILFFSLLGSIVLTGVLLGRQLARDAQQARVRDPRWDTPGFRRWASKGQVAFLKVRWPACCS